MAVLAALAAVAALALAGCGSVSAPAGDRPGTPPASARPSTATPVPKVPVAVPTAALRTALGCPSSTPVAVDHRLDVPTTDPATVMVAHCVSAAGSPPSGVYVVARSGSGSRIAATLVPATAQIDVSSVTQNAGTVRVSGLGYSKPTVPRCCPDVAVGRAWHIRGDSLVPAG